MRGEHPHSQLRVCFVGELFLPVRLRVRWGGRQLAHHVVPRYTGLSAWQCTHTAFCLLSVKISTICSGMMDNAGQFATSVPGVNSKSCIELRLSGVIAICKRFPPECHRNGADAAQTNSLWVAMFFFWPVVTCCNGMSAKIFRMSQRLSSTLFFLQYTSALEDKVEYSPGSREKQSQKAGPGN